MITNYKHSIRFKSIKVEQVSKTISYKYTLKIFDDFIRKQTTYAVMLFSMKKYIYIYSEGLFNTLRIEIKYKHLLLGQNKL